MKLRVKDPHGTEEYRVEVNDLIIWVGPWFEVNFVLPTQVESENVTVLDLKKAIEREIGEEPERQMLVHMGQGLDDGT